jgi:hypothetical protein
MGRPGRSRLRISSWHFSPVPYDLFNAGGCGGRREPWVINQVKGSTMDVKTNVKVGTSNNPFPIRLH